MDSCNYINRYRYGISVKMLVMRGLIFIVFALLLFHSCDSNIETQAHEDNQPSGLLINDPTPNSTYTQEFIDDNSGNVYYYNPQTGYEANYTLDADVDDEGNVSTIYFPNGGYIDESHIVSQEVEDGITIVETDRGQIFEVDNEIETIDEE